MASPSATPAHASTRATNPSRQPPMPAPTPSTSTTRSSAFNSGSGCSVRREQTRVREESGVRDHPMVGPDRLPFYMPAALEHLDRLRHTEGRVRDLLAEPAHLEDRGQVRHEN